MNWGQVSYDIVDLWAKVGAFGRIWTKQSLNCPTTTFGCSHVDCRDFEMIRIYLRLTEQSCKSINNKCSLIRLIWSTFMISDIIFFYHVYSWINFSHSIIWLQKMVCACIVKVYCIIVSKCQARSSSDYIKYSQLQCTCM